MSTWKKVNNADPGDASRFGGNDIDEFYGLLNGENTSSKNIILRRWHKLGNSQTYFLDPDENHWVRFNVSNQTGDRFINIPDLGASDRTPVFTDMSQTVTNKAFGAGCTLSSALDANDNGINDLNYINLRSTDGVNEVAIFSRAASAPDIDIHFIANYTKQTSATADRIFFGYNSDITSFEFYSKWPGSNTQLLTIDAANNKLELRKFSVFHGGLQLQDGQNIVFQSSSGTKIGTATTQKFAFWNATPVTQRSGISDVASDAVDTTYGTQESNVITSLRTKVNAILQVLEDLGITAVA
jgi:hypothetical protein